MPVKYPLRSGFWSLHQEVEDEDDVRKIWHVATHSETGEKIIINHHPFEWMTPDAFEAHVRLRFPSPEGVGPWKNDTVIEAGREAS